MGRLSGARKKCPRQESNLQPSASESVGRDHSRSSQLRVLQKQGVFGPVFFGFAIGMLGTGNTFGNTFWEQSSPGSARAAFRFIRVLVAGPG